MNLKDISHLRLKSQQIAQTKFSTAKDIVAWMGAMQAQDYAMSRWAVGVRLPGSTEDMIGAAMDSGEIIRTHLLRPTWHLVSADDIHWMLDLTAPQIRTLLKSRLRELEITTQILAKSSKVIEKALTGDNHLTRDELAARLEKAGIATDNNRLSHLLLQAEMDKLICSGAVKGKKPTYALLDERVPEAKKLGREEALAALAKRYFTSHCPATLQDFIWWSGLPVTNARSALEMIKSRFFSETVGSRHYWFPDSFPTDEVVKRSVYLLPAFDEFVISYKDRSASLSNERHKKAVSNNGIFRPVIVVNGQITGLWKRSLVKNVITVETSFFEPHSKAAKQFIEDKSALFGRFLTREIKIIHNDA